MREKWPLLAKTNSCKSTRACFNVKREDVVLHELNRRNYIDAEGVEQHETNKMNRETNEERNSQRSKQRGESVILTRVRKSISLVAT